MARYAAIDAGTNSTKITIAEVGADGTPVIVETGFEPTRLGLDLRDGFLSSEAIARSAGVLGRFVALAEAHKVDDIRAVATYFAREARNFEMLQVAVRHICGLELEVISGEEEGRLIYLAISQDFSEAEMPLVAFNIGGGSTELIYGRTLPEQMVSLPLGASLITRRFPETTGKVSKKQMQEVSNYIASVIRAQVSFLDIAQTAKTLVGSGGTMTNLSAVDNARWWGDDSKVHLYQLPTRQLRAGVEGLARLGEVRRAKVPGLSPDRAGIIVSGGLIGLTIAELLAMPGMTVAMRGLRDGIIAEFAAQRA